MPFKVLSSSSQSKKKPPPPPRPPPPNLNKLKSKSTHNIRTKFDTLNLIDWSPPNSPRNEPLAAKFGGSVSSSFSSSTSSLSSIKKNGNNSDCEGFLPTAWGPTQIASSNNNNNNNNNNFKPYDGNFVGTASLMRPTIIRSRTKKNYRPEVHSTASPSLPMPTGPPPSPPEDDVSEVVTPYGIALYEFPATQPGDLGLEVDDVVILIRRVNSEWLYGQIGDREGICPENFINVINPLPEDLR